MRKSVVLVTGCDAPFFDFMLETLQSLVALNIDQRADIGILDLGLTAEQVSSLQAMGYSVVRPSWTLDVPEKFQGKHHLGLVARTALREYFPGYGIYLWFDADAWAQTPEFFDDLVAGAQAEGAAVAREDGANYRRTLTYSKWWIGNMMAAYGPIRGLRVALRPAMNIGILALSDRAPHWDAWIRYYKHFIAQRSRVSNQHSFNAMVELEKIPCAPVSARCNWICNLSEPVWDPGSKRMCDPGKANKPLSVLHLAGPDKRRIYGLRQVGGGRIQSALTFSAVRELRGN